MDDTNRSHIAWTTLVPHSMRSYHFIRITIITPCLILSDLPLTLPRILCSYVLIYVYVETWEGCLSGYSHFTCYLDQLLLRRNDMPSSLVSLHQTPTYMPRLDCPSVSAETLNP